MPTEEQRILQMEREELNYRMPGGIFGLTHPRWENTHPFNVTHVDLVPQQVKADGTAAPARVEIFGEEVQTQRGKTREVSYPLRGEVCFHYSSPNLGAINVHDQVVYLSRTPERQSRRGLRQNNITIFNPNSRDLQFADLPQQFNRLSDRSLMWSIFNPQYFSLGKAVAQVNDGAVLARALSPNLYVYSSFGLRHPLLGYKTRAIGHFTANDRLLVYTNFRPLVEQIQETNDRNAVTIEVQGP